MAFYMAANPQLIHSVITSPVRAANRALDSLAPVIDLGIRLIVASAFFRSGLTKMTNWDATVGLFASHHAAPLLSHETAALLGTGIELMFPVLLVLGLGARLAALVLLVLSIVAVTSYPDLGLAGLRDHQTWGLLLLITLLHGPGKLSLDHLIGLRFNESRGM
jgi:putative oxidoreductase